MARQSATNPRFRCNGCKDYYSAPEHTVHYQCASHGYLCEKHLVKKGDRLKKVYDRGFVKIPANHIGKCKEGNKGSELAKSGLVYDSEYATIGFSNANIIEREVCLKVPVRFNWHEDVGRWIEEGREEEEKAKAKPKAKSKTKPDYLKEINVLLDLLEDDTLTKEVFIKKMREKIN